MQGHATRTPEECSALANRQKAGEDLGFSDEFVRQWAGKGGAAAKPEAPAPKAEAKEEKAAAKEEKAAAKEEKAAK